MTDAPKPLTEADVKRLHHVPHGLIQTVIDELRERGLIADEPVDPLLIEAREIGAKWGQDAMAGILDGAWDNSIYMRVALAALKRGLELAQPTLTREMVADCLNHAGLLRYMGKARTEALWSELHAALTKGTDHA